MRQFNDWRIFFMFKPLLFTMLTITTCKTYPSAPQNLIPVQTQLSDQGIPTQFFALARNITKSVYSAFSGMGLCEFL